MFKVSPLSSHTGAKPSTPLVDCLVNDRTMQQSGAVSRQQRNLATSSKGDLNF